MPRRSVKPYKLEVVEPDEYLYPSLEAAWKAALPEVAKALVESVRDGLASGIPIAVDGKVVPATNEEDS